MKVLIVKHVDIEGPGLIEDYLRHENMAYLILDLPSGQSFPKFDQFSHIIILGGPMNVYQEGLYPFLRDEDRLIKEAIQKGRPLLGICLGAQLIAKALGAKVFRAPAKEIGWDSVSLTEEGLRDPLFSSFPKTFPVFQWHEDTFDIPSGARLIATSGSVPNQAFRYGDNVHGLQFHLEVTPEMIRTWMGSWEEELLGASPLLHSRDDILLEAEREFNPYRERGQLFLNAFFKELNL